MDGCASILKILVAVNDEKNYANIKKQFYIIIWSLRSSYKQQFKINPLMLSVGISCK